MFSNDNRPNHKTMTIQAKHFYKNTFTGAHFFALTDDLYQDEEYTYDEPFFGALMLNGDKAGTTTAVLSKTVEPLTDQNLIKEYSIRIQKAVESQNKN